MKRKNIIFWVIAVGLMAGLMVGLAAWFSLRSINPASTNIVPEKQHASIQLNHKKTDKKQNALSLIVSKKKIAHSHLDLELKGTIIGDGSKPLAVIFKVKEKKEILVKEGDKIDAAVVRQIMKEKVLLWVGGRLEILLLKQRKTIFTKDNGEDIAGFNSTAAISWSDINALGVRR